MELEAALEQGGLRRGVLACAPLPPKSCPSWVGARSKPLCTLPGQIWPRGLKRRPRSSPFGARLPPPPAPHFPLKHLQHRGAGWATWGGLERGGPAPCTMWVQLQASFLGALHPTQPLPHPPPRVTPAPSLPCCCLLAWCFASTPPNGFRVGGGTQMDVGIPPPTLALFPRLIFKPGPGEKRGWGGEPKISLESGGTGGGHTHKMGPGGVSPCPRPGPRSEALLLRGTCCAEGGRILGGGGALSFRLISLKNIILVQ